MIRSIEILETRALLAVATLNGSGLLRIEDPVGVNDTLTIQSDTAKDLLVIIDPNHVLSTSIPGATGDGTNTLEIRSAAVNQITINTLSGTDSVTVDASLGAFSQSLTISSGDDNDSIAINGFGDSSPVSATIDGQGGVYSVTFGMETMLAGGHLSVIGETIRLNSNVEVATIGDGTVQLSAARNIELDDGSSIVTVDGNVALQANQQEVATSGDFNGITLDGAESPVRRVTFSCRAQAETPVDRTVFD